MAQVRQREHDVLLGHGAGVVDDVAGVVVDADVGMVDLREDPDADGGGRQQVGVGLDAEPDAGLLRLVGDRADVLLNVSISSGVEASPVKVFSTWMPSCLAGAEHVRQPLHADVEMQRRVSAHRDARQPVPIE